VGFRTKKKNQENGGEQDQTPCPPPQASFGVLEFVEEPPDHSMIGMITKIVDPKELGRQL